MSAESEANEKEAAGDKSKPKAGIGRLLKRIALGVGGVVVLGAGGVGIWVLVQASAYDKSITKVYDVAPVPVTLSTDAAVIARGKHLSQSLAPCANTECHGADLANGKATEAGPIGTVVAPNLTKELANYDDGQLARLIKHGIKKDGTSARFMPSDEWNWLPKSDIDALVSYLRTVKPIDGPSSRPVIGTFGKVFDRVGWVPIDVARRIQHDKIETGPATPTPTAEYGKWIAMACRGCHGDKHLSGGPIPGAPPDFPVPLNLTPHETGLKGWTYEDFDGLAKTGNRKNGQKLATFMPIEAIRNMDETEKKALFAYLQSLPPVATGNR